MIRLSAADLARIDQEAAHYSKALDRLIKSTRDLDADDGGVPTIAQLATVLRGELHHAKVVAICATAILRLARQPASHLRAEEAQL